MQPSALKEVVSPKRIKVDLGEDKEVTVGQFKFGQLPLVLILIEKFYDVIVQIAEDSETEDPKSDMEVIMKVFRVLSQDFETVSDLLAGCAGLTRKELEDMDVEPVINLGLAVFEVNSDFLSRKFREIAERRAQILQDQKAQ